MSELHFAQALLSKHHYARWARRYSPGYLAFTAAVFALAALLTFSTAIWALMKSSELAALRDGSKTQGRIVALEVKKHWQKKSPYESAVTYTFVDRNGGEHQTIAHRTSMAPPPFKNGERIDVLYAPAHPETSTILPGLSELVDNHKFTFGIALFGTALLLISVARYVQWRRSRKGAETAGTP